MHVLRDWYLASVVLKSFSICSLLVQDRTSAKNKTIAGMQKSTVAKLGVRLDAIVWQNQHQHRH